MNWLFPGNIGLTRFELHAVDFFRPSKGKV